MPAGGVAFNDGGAAWLARGPSEDTWKTVGLSATDALRLVETLTQAIQLSGASAQDAQPAVVQLGQLSADDLTAARQNLDAAESSTSRPRSAIRPSIRSMASGRSCANSTKRESYSKTWRKLCPARHLRRPL